MRSGVAALAAGNLIGAGLGFLLAVLIGRVTGDSGLGAYAAAAAWIFPLSLVVDAGLSGLLTREAAANPQQADGLLRATIRARGVMGGTVMTLIIVCAPFLTSTSAASDALRLGAPLVLLNPLVGAYTALFRARQQMRRAAALNVGMLVAQVGLTGGALALGWGVGGAMLANVASSGLQLCAAWGIHRRDLPHNTAEIVSSRRLLRAAWPFAIASVLAAIQMRMGAAFTELWAGVGAAGLYAAAYRFIEAGRLIPQAGFDALLPALSAVRADPAEFSRRARRAGLMIVGYGALFGVGCATLAGWGVPFLFGETFASSGDLLRGMGFALLPMSLKYWAGVAWIARGEERRVTRLNAVGLVAQLIISAALIPTHGAAGAAWSLVLGEIFGAGVMLWGNPIHDGSNFLP